MAQAPTSASIAPKVILRRIEISLPQYGAPEIKMFGDVSVGNPRVGRVSEARIVTHHLPESGRRFIEDMEEAFAVTKPAARGETKQ